jgi:hypothetical protein
MKPVYTIEELEALKRPQLWEICEAIALPKYPASAKCIEAIMSKQPVKVLEQAVAQVENVEAISPISIIEKAGLSIVDCHNGQYLINSPDLSQTLKVCYTEEEDLRFCVQAMPGYQELYRSEHLDVEGLKEAFLWIIQYFKPNSLEKNEEPALAIFDCNFYDADKGLRHAFKINNQLIGHIWHSDNGNWDNFEGFWINGDGVEYHDWRECGLNLVQSNQPVKVDSPKSVDGIEAANIGQVSDTTDTFVVASVAVIAHEPAAVSHYDYACLYGFTFYQKECDVLCWIGRKGNFRTIAYPELNSAVKAALIRLKKEGIEVTSADTEQDKIEIEAILEQTEVDEIPDQDFGSLCRLWYQTTLLGTFYRKIFSDDWRATPAGSIEPYHCPNEDDAKYWLVFDYLKVASPQLQLPISDSQLPTTKNQISKTLMLASSCFLLLVAYKLDIEEIHQPIDNGSQLASSEVVECSYRGVGRREDCLQVP